MKTKSPEIISEPFAIFEVTKLTKMDTANLDNITEEIWKDVPGFNGRYQASNRGNVRSLNMRHGQRGIKSQHILTGAKHHTGYLIMKLRPAEKVAKILPLHRILAITFIPNPNNYPQVNHKDGNKLNNSLDNLEWCTQQQNTIHAYAIGLAKSGTNHKQSKKVLQMKDGIVIKEWGSISDAERHFGKKPSGICKSLKFANRSAYGYKWQYA